MVVSITKHNFKQEIEQSPKPVIIEVYGTWCGPCQHMAPLFEELEKEMNATHKFAKLNVDESREIVKDYGVTTIPSFLFIKDNALVGKESGTMTKEDLKAKIEELLA